MSRKSFQRKDRFYKKAKDEGFVARSAYKIIEFDKLFHIFKPGKTIIDLGCAPGGWLQVAQRKMKDQGKLIGIDLLDLQIGLSPNTLFLKDDFLKQSSLDWLKEQSGGEADWILSDMAPNLTGIKFKDQLALDALCQQALTLTKELLKNKGSLLFKFFPSPEMEDLKRELKTQFEKVEMKKPEATRGSSNEFYMVCLNFKKPNS